MNSPIFLPLVLALAAPFVGSLLGVLVMRLPEGRPVAIGRSACEVCHQPLGPLDLVPLASYAILRGRCRHCGARIAPIHPLIELAALAVAIWAATATSGAMLIAACVFGWMLLALALTAIRSGVLPNALTWPLAIFGFVAIYELAPQTLLDHVIGAVAGFVLGLLIVLAEKNIRGGPICLSVALFLGAIGAWLAWQRLPYVIAIAILTIACAALVRSRPRIAASIRAVAGAAVALAAWIVWLYPPTF